MAQKKIQPDFSKHNNHRIQEDAQQLFAESTKSPVGNSQGNTAHRALDPNRTRDGILRSYDAKNATRARNARLENIEAIKEFSTRDQQRREREQVKRDLVSSIPSRNVNPETSTFRGRPSGMRRPTRPTSTSDRMHDEAMEQRKRVENERLRRDALLHRSGDRELIDGRGSIDSRALNERNELVGYTIDANDAHEPDVDSIESGTKWVSRNGQDIRSYSDSITSRSDLHGARQGLSSISAPVKVLGILIIVLLIILCFLLFF